MKYAIGLLELDFSLGNVVESQVKAPCRVLHGYFVHKPKSLVVVRKDSEQTVPVPMLVVEIDPDGPLITKRFVGVVPGIRIDTAEPPFCGEELEHVATIINPNDGRPLVVYEAPVPVPVDVRLDDRPKAASGEIEAS